MTIDARTPFTTPQDATARQLRADWDWPALWAESQLGAWTRARLFRRRSLAWFRRPS